MRGIFNGSFMNDFPVSHVWLPRIIQWNPCWKQARHMRLVFSTGHLKNNRHMQTLDICNSWWILQRPYWPSEEICGYQGKLLKSHWYPRIYWWISSDVNMVEIKISWISVCFSDSAWLPGFAAKLQTTACLPDLRTGRQIETTTEHKF